MMQLVKVHQGFKAGDRVLAHLPGGPRYALVLAVSQEGLQLALKRPVAQRVKEMLPWVALP